MKISEIPEIKAFAVSKKGAKIRTKFKGEAVRSKLRIKSHLLWMRAANVLHKAALKFEKERVLVAGKLQ